MENKVDDQQSLQQSVARVQEALAKQPAPLAEVALSRGGAAPSKPNLLGGGLAITALFLATALALESWPLAMVALALAAVGGAAFAIRRSRPAAGLIGVPYIGIGATVAEDAVVEPGAVIEMGAEVKAGAIVRSGAVVRMGATVWRDAVIESGAVVSWGDLHAGGAGLAVRAAAQRRSRGARGACR
jgi:hypothetical protein